MISTSFLPSPLWTTITGFGGVAVTVPVAVAIAAWLAAGMRLRAAFEWLALLGVAAGLTLLTKLAFLGWGFGIRPLDFTGISGHAVMSTTVFPVMLSVVLLGAPALVRRAGFVAGLALGIMIGASRVAVKAHSISEIVAGCVIGALVACIFVSRLENREAQTTTATPHPLLVSLSLVALIGALHGLHLPTQRWVTSLALDLSGHERPFIRARWHREGRIAPKLVDNVSSARPIAPDS
jgi:membrane-associated phospholipid phosphatase